MRLTPGRPAVPARGAADARGGAGGPARPGAVVRGDSRGRGAPRADPDAAERRRASGRPHRGIPGQPPWGDRVRTDRRQRPARGGSSAAGASTSPSSSCRRRRRPDSTCTSSSSEKMQLLCHDGHPLSGRDHVELAELVAEPFVETPVSWGNRLATDVRPSRGPDSAAVSRTR
ncbi:hypothetical protein ACRAWF_33600 [Streptomyces sp. L7]